MKPGILITGGSGLLALNWALAVRGSCDVTLGLHNRRISLAGVTTKIINIESEDDLSRTLEELNIRVVIHAAGLTSVEECEADPELAHYANVTLAVNVARACKLRGIQMVHISTDHLFSGAESLKTEDQPVAPINVYGKTKAEAECRVLEIIPQSLVVRTNFFGWGTNYRHSFSDTITNGLRQNKELRLFKDVFYTPILVEVAALAVHDLLGLQASGIFNVVSDERLSKYEFGLKVAEGFDLDPRGIIPSRLADQKNLVRRPHDMSLSNQKVCDLLGRRLGFVRAHLDRLRQQGSNGWPLELSALSTRPI